MQQSAVKRLPAAKKRIRTSAGMGFQARMPAFDSLLGSLRGCLDRFPDKRPGMNATYGIGDIGMAASSVFFMQRLGGSHCFANDMHGLETGSQEAAPLKPTPHLRTPSRQRPARSYRFRPHSSNL
jgi:hypothetical protein